MRSFPLRTAALLTGVLVALPVVVRAEKGEKVPVLSIRVEIGHSFTTELEGSRVGDTLVIDARLDSPWTGEQGGSVTIDYGQLRAPRTPRPRARRRAYVPSFMDGVHLRRADRGVLSTWSGPLRYSLAYETRQGQTDPGWGSLAAPSAFVGAVDWCWSQLEGFLDNHGIRTDRDRGPDYNVNFFAVWRQTLAEPECSRQMYEPLDKVWQPGSVLWGYYDSTLEVANESAVIVTPVGGSATRGVLCHELAHYSWDFFMIGPNWNGTSESFATAFQSTVQ